MGELRERRQMMAIITVYQGASGSGEGLAEVVAETLGYGCVSREVLIQASLRYGIPEARLDELAEKELHWWNRFLQNLEPYRLALQKAIPPMEFFLGELADSSFESSIV